jgi:hypothetical protein
MDYNDSDTVNIDELIEKKLFDNLKWSMLLFVFNQVCDNVANDGEDNKISTQKLFFKEWKKFVITNMVQDDLNTINKTLNSPLNMFFSVLQNKGDEIKTTEEYQEKYNKIIKKIEKEFNENFE